MAVEIDYASKRLHKHVLPLLMITSGLFGLAFLSISHFSSSDVNSEEIIGRSLFTKVIHVEPTSSGLAKFSLEEQSANKSGVLANTGIEQAGQATQLSISLQ